MKTEFLEIQKHLLNDEEPSKYIKQQVNDGGFDDSPLSMIKNLIKVEQNPKFHPEGNVFIHTMMTIDEGAKIREKSTNKIVFMWTLILHDIGKGPTTKLRNGKLTSYNHDIVGAEMAREFLNYYRVDESVTNKICALIRYHMQILFTVKQSRYERLDEMIRAVDTDEIILVSQCDRLGRGNMNISNKNSVETEIEKFKKIINDKKY